MAEARVAIVTGGTHGIGRAITATLAARGYAVVAVGNDAAQAEGTQELLRERGLQADTREADVAVNSDVEGVVRFTLEKYGRVDALCNNAGIYTRGTVLTVTEEAWDRTMAVNFERHVPVRQGGDPPHDRGRRRRHREHRLRVQLRQPQPRRLLRRQGRRAGTHAGAGHGPRAGPHPRERAACPASSSAA